MSRPKRGERIIADGGAYKRIYRDPWGFHPLFVRWSKEDAIRMYEERTGPNASCTWPYNEEFKKDYPTLEKFLEYWAKCMIRK